MNHKPKTMNPPSRHSIKNAAPFRPNPKKINFFYNFLISYLTIIYLFSVPSVSSVANTFFASNTQVRVIIETVNMSPYIWSKVCSLSTITFGEAEAMIVCLGWKIQSKEG